MDSTLSQQQHKKIHHQPERGPHGLGSSLNPKPDTSRGRAQLRRQWTTCKSRPGPSSSSSMVTAALPLPFMELSVSVVDTLDLLSSSIKEEIVFQATLQVPAHHAIACRIDAYDTPFANAPALKAEPHQLTESDKQFAACLASPPDLEEAHSFTFSRPATVLERRQAPELRAGSGLVTVTLSMRQRQSSQKQQDDDTADDDTPLPPDAGQTLDSSSLMHQQQQRQQQQQYQALQRQGSLLVLQRTGSMTGSGSSFSQQLHPWQGLKPAFTAAAAAAAGRSHSWSSAAGVIPEDVAAEYADIIISSRAQDRAAADDWAADHDDVVDDDDNENAQFSRALSCLQSRSVLRMESFSPAGRMQLQEVPIAATTGANALAFLLGFGYMVLHSWQARTEPASGLIKRHVDAFAGTGLARNKLIVS